MRANKLFLAMAAGGSESPCRRRLTPSETGDMGAAFAYDPRPEFACARIFEKGRHVVQFKEVKIPEGDLIGYENGELVSVSASWRDGTPRLLAVLLARQREIRGEQGALRGMPLGLPPLSPEQIQLVETWIAQGRPR